MLHKSNPIIELLLLSTGISGILKSSLIRIKCLLHSNIGFVSAMKSVIPVRLTNTTGLLGTLINVPMGNAEVISDSSGKY